MNIQSKINKLIKALSIKGIIYLVNREQFYSNANSKVCSVYKLFHLMPVEEFNTLFPDDKKDPDKYENIKLQVLTTFKQEEILLKLVDEYKKAGESNE